jgi:hypothetical protein
MEDPNQLTPPSSSSPGDDNENRLRFFTTPLSQRGWPTWMIYALAVLGLIYILNPTLGIIEFIPDNLPLVGNLDEGAAFLLMWFGLLEFLQGKKPPSA